MEEDCRQKLDEALAEIERLEKWNRGLRREMHARIKNAYQIASVFLDMTLINAATPGAEAAPVALVPASGVRWSVRQLRILAAVYDLELGLDDRSDDSCLEIRDVPIARLLGRMNDLLDGFPPHLIRWGPIADGTLPRGRIGSLALAVSELFENARTHGRAPIDISLYPDGEELVLEVRDAGKGFPSDTLDKSRFGNGLEMIQTVVQGDLKGRVELDNPPEGGARGRVFFKPGECD